MQKDTYRGSIVGKRRKEFPNGFGLCPRMIYITLDALFNPPPPNGRIMIAAELI